MMRLIFNAVLLSAAIAIALVYIKPTYEDPTDGIVFLQEKKANLLIARSTLTELKKKQTELQAQEKEIPLGDINKLEKLLPKEINPVLFIMELDTIAKEQGMSIKNIKFDSTKKEATTPAAAPASGPKKPYETFMVTFDVAGSYQSFSNFLSLVEQGLRVTNITAVTLVANDKVDVYQYTVKAQTYWLK